MEENADERKEVVSVPVGNGLTVDIVTDWAVGIGGGVWSACSLFCDHILGHRDFYAPRFAGKRILELGAGTGLAGILAALVGPPREVVITDIGAHVGILRDNLERNRELLAAHGAPCRAEEYDWAARDMSAIGDPYDVVIGTDVAYHPSLYDDCADAIWRTTKPGGVAIIGATKTDTGPSFFRKVASRGFTYHRVPEEHMSLHGNASFNLFIIFRQR